MDTMRDSMIFYRSFYECVVDLPAEVKLEVWNAIFEYSLNFNHDVNSLQLSTIGRAVFTLIKPQLDANLKRYENGNKPKRKRDQSKTEATDKLKISEHEANDNVNVNDNVNDNEKKVRTKRTFSPPSLDEWIEYFLSNGYSKEVAQRSFQSYAVADWYDSKGNKIKNWKQKATQVWFKPENVAPLQPQQKQVYNPATRYNPSGAHNG